MHKRFLSAALISLCSAVISITAVSAVSPPVIDPNSVLDENQPLLISSIHIGKGVGFVELHNQSSKPLKLSSWKLQYIGSQNSEIDIMLPSSWLLKDSFVVLSENGSVPGTLNFPSLALNTDETIQAVQLIDQNNNPVSKLESMPADVSTKWYQRKSTGMSGVFANDFSAATASAKLRHTPPYQPPAAHTQLQITEIYPHAKSCAPNDTSPVCGDYIKLFNPSDASLDIGNYRLRSDSGSSESGNAFHLDNYASVPAKGYLTVRLRDDGDNLSLTDSGGYVWLEDAEGVEKYNETIVEYPDAGSASKVGWAWAIDGNNQWQWTGTPSPDTANSFPAPGMGGMVDAASLAPCPVGKYRNPDTNRCRTVEEAINDLAVCDEGSERNPETNRCRKVATLASATVTPCDIGQERNPETNRCRKVGADTTTLKPCNPDQERNPDTGRCRKVTNTSKSANIIDQPPKKSLFNTNSLVLGIVGIAAVSYGVYEWRGEIAGGFKRLVAAIGKK